MQLIIIIYNKNKLFKEKNVMIKDRIFVCFFNQYPNVQMHQVMKRLQLPGAKASASSDGGSSSRVVALLDVVVGSDR